jgi:hypothetical protein
MLLSSIGNATCFRENTPAPIAPPLSWACLWAKPPLSMADPKDRQDW